MKKQYILFCITAILLTAVSCNKWLDDVKQTSKADDVVIWQSEKSVDANINAFYTYLHKYSQFGEQQFGGSFMESLTDSFKYGSNALGHRAGHPNNYVINPELISEDGCLYSIWDAAYGQINKQINNFLNSQKLYSKFSQEKNDLWEAQARFFRAFVYFQLAKRHCNGNDGGLIIYDALPVGPDKDKASASEVWDFIEDDIDFAASKLPVAWNAANTGRVTKGAAFAFKSRVMLYAERWQKAMEAADSVEALNIYSLVPDYANAWKGGNSEAILQFSYNKNTGPNHRFDQYYVPQCDGYDFGALGTPTQEMVESYEDKNGNKVDWTPWHTTTDVTPPYDQLEPRFAATIIYRGSTWKGRVMDCSVGGPNGVFMAYKEQSYSYGKTTTGYFLRKLLDEKLIDVKGLKSDQPWVEIRYAEVLLNKAEAAFRLGESAIALEYLNKVRQRVNLPKKNSTGDQFFADLRNERKVELAYEGHLFWDMRRWRLAHIEYNNYVCHGFKIYPDTNTYEYIEVDDEPRRFLERLYILPIPSAELKNNGSIKQFPSWL